MAATGGLPTVAVGEITRALQAAYAQLKGAEANKALVPYSLDHAIQEQIDSLKTDSSSTGAVSAVDTKYSTSKSKRKKPTKYERLLAVQSDLQKIVDTVKKAGDDPAKLSKLGLGG